MSQTIKNNELATARPSEYESLADEYYDSSLHPTCKNFRNASRLWLLSIWKKIDWKGDLLEVGCGKSLLAKELRGRGVAPSNLNLLDSSPSMLRHSEEWSKYGAKLICRDASGTGLANKSVDLIFSSLGDPYNTKEFWREASRILRPDGKVLFSYPAHEWTIFYRSQFQAGGLYEAEFLNRFGETLLMPSFVYSDKDQVAMVGSCGLRILDKYQVQKSQIDPPLSPRVECCPNDMSIVTGILLEKTDTR